MICRTLCIVTLMLTVDAFEGVKAQDYPARFGFGTGLVLNPGNDAVADDELGLDFRGRISQPLNEDVSLAGSIGLLTFALNGTADADYVLNPQAELIVTLPGEDRMPYIIFGVAGLFPTTSDGESQFALQGGYGLVWPLRSVSFFVEANPMLAFDSNSTSFIVPLRTGLIF